MLREKTTCASCESYPLQQAAQAGGKARCPWREAEYEWSDNACVLHNRAKDYEARKRLVIRLIKEREKAT